MDGVVEVFLASTIFNREYFGRRPTNTPYSLVEILLAEGQLNLFFGLDSPKWRIFRPKADKKLNSLVEILLAEGQLNLFSVLTLLTGEYFGRRPKKTKNSLVEILLAEGQLTLFFGLDSPKWIIFRPKADKN